MMPGGNGPEWPKTAYIPRAEMDFTLHCFLGTSNIISDPVIRVIIEFEQVFLSFELSHIR
jgi:hypothetical protein